MKINVRDNKLGKCEIETYSDIGKAEEYTIKSLAMLQIACMDKTNTKKLKELVSILSEAIEKADQLFDEDKILEKPNEPDILADF